jgi:hypothetical protein
MGRVNSRDPHGEQVAAPRIIESISTMAGTPVCCVEPHNLTNARYDFV